MKTILAILLATLCAATGYGQTMKALSYNTNGRIVYSGTNELMFTNAVGFAEGDLEITEAGGIAWAGELKYEPESQTFFSALAFSSTNVSATTRTNLGAQATLISGTNIKTINGQPILGAGDLVISGGTNTNSFNQSLNTTDDVTFVSVSAGQFEAGNGTNTVSVDGLGMTFSGNSAATTRTNLALGATNIVTFAGLTNNGDITINSTTASNGLLYIRRTNNEPFLGMANLLASNNTTISNETLFRVGVAEATNRSAQFGFRSTNTNGSGVAVFSVFGYNALMMVGVDASTNAVIFSGGGTNNEVMTLIKSGATEFARPISFSTTAHAAATRTNLALGATSDPTFRDVSVRDLSIVGGSGGKIIYPQTNTAPANTTNAVTWIQVNVGTNSYRVPLYQ